jgi:hypothetical protein
MRVMLDFMKEMSFLQGDILLLKRGLTVDGIELLGRIGCNGGRV